jgi:(R,R)-butanediol dehydrogenase/meso-butanediol dehydrogenase/diacetyl reductase
VKAARLYGEEDIRIDDVEAPTPGEGEVLVDVAACGICGSDLHFYQHTDDFFDDEDLPQTLGHEIGGTIAATGEGVDLAVGTEVVLGPHTPCGECWCCEEGKYNLCRDLNATSARPGGYAEQVVESADNAVPLPDGVSPADAAIAQPVSVGLHAVRQSPLGVGDSVAVVGAGPIGLGAIRSAKAAGGGPIYVSEPQDSRREVAADFGADVLIDPTEEDPVERIHEETGRGADVAFEAVGHENTLTQAVESTRADGHTTVIGVFSGPAEFEPQLLVQDQRTVGGSTSHLVGPRLTEEYGVVIRQLENGDLDAEKYVTSRVGLDDIVADGFDALTDDESEERKILVCP